MPTSLKIPVTAAAGATDDATDGATDSLAPKDFESAMKELESLTYEMENGDLSLEDSLAAYKRGMELSNFCQKKLEDAELQIKVLENGSLKDYIPRTSPNSNGNNSNV